MSINESSMWAAVHRMESASEQMARAAEEITQAVQRFAYLLEPGYGGNGLRLIELLEQTAPQPEQSETVLVPVSVIEEAAHMLEAHSPGSGSVESFTAQDLRAALSARGGNS